MKTFHSVASALHEAYFWAYKRQIILIGRNLFYIHIYLYHTVIVVVSGLLPIKYINCRLVSKMALVKPYRKREGSLNLKLKNFFSLYFTVYKLCKLQRAPLKSYQVQIKLIESEKIFKYFHLYPSFHYILVFSKNCRTKYLSECQI